MRASNIALDFAEALSQKHTGYEFAVLAGRTYDKIVQERTATYGSGRSVHAFVVRGTGELVKAATFKAPQKNTEGKLAVRFNLSDPEDAQRAVELSDPHGGYLYQR